MDQDHGATVNEWVNVVRRARLGSAVHSVAMTLATYADPDGTNIYPGLARLAVECEISLAAAKRALRRLRQIGLVEVARRGSRRRGRSDEYRLIIAADLLDRVDVPTPDEHAKAVEALKEAERAGAARRYRARVLGSAVTREGEFSGQQDASSRVTGDPPPSIGTHPEVHPPPDDRDLRTEVAVGGGSGGRDALAPLAPDTHQEDDDDDRDTEAAAASPRGQLPTCRSCGVYLDPDYRCGNHACTDWTTHQPDR